ncbi:hypothetical protein EVAR_71007_1 [Eumeta japonica]|uniref:Uncharacterized protein n=1 Tax=Eumeta variegata TaxID=151549 RepID=A0A4C2A965_EUMVA|nr:hypothetical protein EVAR_71007_1 [Eumeta japonica]
MSWRHMAMETRVYTDPVVRYVGIRTMRVVSKWINCAREETPRLPVCQMIGGPNGSHLGEGHTEKKHRQIPTRWSNDIKSVAGNWLEKGNNREKWAEMEEAFTQGLHSNSF